MKQQPPLVIGGTYQMTKEYIIELESTFDSEIEEYFLTRGSNILFFDEILPELVIIETDQDISTFKYVSSYREPRTGYLLKGKNESGFKNVRMEPEVDSDALHEFGYGFGVKIAVLDAGIDKDICPDVKEEEDFTGIGLYTESPHGSIVTRIIKSFAKAAQVYSAKVCHDEDSLKETNVFRALKWAREKNVHVINMSLGFPYDCDGTCQLSKYINKIVRDFGIFVVAAAGNDFNAEGKKVHCPACANEVISVGSLTKDGLDVASFSVPGKPNSDKPNILTSGYGRLETLTYSTPFRGTSFSAPVVTGIIGCLVSYIPNMDITVLSELEQKRTVMQKVKMKLYETTTYLDGVFSSRQGLGKVNLQKLLEVLRSENQSNSRGKAN